MIPTLCLGQIKNDLLIGRLKVQSLSRCHQHDIEGNRNRNACINFIYKRFTHAQGNPVRIANDCWRTDATSLF